MELKQSKSIQELDQAGLYEISGLATWTKYVWRIYQYSDQSIYL